MCVVILNAGQVSLITNKSECCLRVSRATHAHRVCRFADRRQEVKAGSVEA